MGIKVYETRKYGITIYVAVFKSKTTQAMSFNGALSQMKNLLRGNKC